MLGCLCIGANGFPGTREHGDLLQCHLPDRSLKDERLFRKNICFICLNKTIRTSQICAHLHQSFSCLIPAFPFSRIPDPVLISGEDAAKQAFFRDFHQETVSCTEKFIAQFRILQEFLAHAQTHDLLADSIPAVAFQNTLLFGGFDQGSGIPAAGKNLFRSCLTASKDGLHVIEELFYSLKAGSHISKGSRILIAEFSPFIIRGFEDENIFSSQICHNVLPPLKQKTTRSYPNIYIYYNALKRSLQRKRPPVPDRLQLRAPRKNESLGTRYVQPLTDDSAVMT